MRRLIGRGKDETKAAGKGAAKPAPVRRARRRFPRDRRDIVMLGLGLVLLRLPPAATLAMAAFIVRTHERTEERHGNILRERARIMEREGRCGPIRT